MRKFLLFFILILPFGCAATSTEQLEQTSQVGKVPAALQQLSEQSEPEEPEVSSGLKIQKILDGRPVYPRARDKISSGTKVQKPLYQGKEGLKLAEPAPEKLLRPWTGINKTQSNVRSLGTRSSPKRRPWNSLWHTPIIRSSPSISKETPSQTIEPPPALWEDYKEIDFGKLASGVYGPQYANKYVKVKCIYSRIAPEFLEFQKYPRPKHITLVVTGINSQLRNFRVVMPRMQADVVFKLKPQKKIVLYGKAVMVDLHTLTMEVLKIER